MLPGSWLSLNNLGEQCLMKRSVEANSESFREALPGFLEGANVNLDPDSQCIMHDPLLKQNDQTGRPTLVLTSKAQNLSQHCWVARRRRASQLLSEICLLKVLWLVLPRIQHQQAAPLGQNLGTSYEFSWQLPLMKPECKAIQIDCCILPALVLKKLGRPRFDPSASAVFPSRSTSSSPPSMRCMVQI